MLAGQAIDVYLSGNVALVQGVVRTAADRVVLGNVLGLEPDVSRIDNRLVVAGYGSLSSNAPAGNVPRTLRKATTPARRPRTVRDRRLTSCGSIGPAPIVRMSMLVFRLSGARAKSCIHRAR